MLLRKRKSFVKILKSKIAILNLCFFFKSVKAFSSLKQFKRHFLIYLLEVVGAQPLLDLIWVKFALAKIQKSAKHRVFATTDLYLLDVSEITKLSHVSILFDHSLVLASVDPRKIQRKTQGSFYEFLQFPFFFFLIY